MTSVIFIIYCIRPETLNTVKPPLTETSPNGHLPIADEMTVIEMCPQSEGFAVYIRSSDLVLIADTVTVIITILYKRSMTINYIISFVFIDSVIDYIVVMHPNKNDPEPETAVCVVVFDSVYLSY